MLSITGIMLNHTNEFNLDKTKINNPLVLGLYETNPKETPISYKTEKHIFSPLDKQIYFDNKKLFNDKQQMRGVTNTGEIIILVLSRDVILLSHDGELIDRYPLAQKTETDENLSQQLLGQYRGEGLPLERIVLDITGPYFWKARRLYHGRCGAVNDIFKLEWLMDVIATPNETASKKKRKRT